MALIRISIKFLEAIQSTRRVSELSWALYGMVGMIIMAGILGYWRRLRDTENSFEYWKYILYLQKIGG